MNLVLIVFVQINIIYVYCGVVKDIIGAVTNNIHKVNEDIHSFIPHHDHHRGHAETEGKENNFNGARNSCTKSESVNERVNGMFGSKEQRGSNEAYTHSRHEQNWSRHPFHANNNRPVKQGNTDYNNKNEYYKNRENVSQDRHSKFTNEYTSNSNFDSSKNNDDHWNSNKEQNNFESTSSYYKPNEKNIIANQSGYNNNNKHNSGPDNTAVVTNSDSVTSIDQIVFPGNINLSTPKTCPEGLIIAANGDCLEPIVIHMGNKTTNDAANRGAGRSFFVGGCLQGYSKTIDGECVEIIYD